MKVHISVDMEGIACVTSREHTKLEGTEYEMARKWMTAETNAAIEGALEAGSSEVVVADSHGHMRNILPDDLNEAAFLIRGAPRPQTMMEGIDSTFSASLFVGYHSQAGNPKGILSHTYISKSIFALRLNGKTIGEPGFNAAIAGHYGVPVALVCGDDTVAAEVSEWMPWAHTVTTKWAISQYAARNLTPKASQKLIRKATREALDHLKEMKPLIIEKPVRLEVEFMIPISATLAGDIPGIERLDGRTLAFTGKDMLEITRIWRLIINSSLGEFYV